MASEYDGLEAAALLREQFPGLPILVLSQYIAAAYARELLSAGANGLGYLLKDRVGNIEEFARAGADIISIHVEATPHIHGALQKIRQAGVKASVVINPGTPVDSIKHVLNLVDQVLVMTVNPGFGGQAFLPETLDKVRELATLREEKGLDFDIEVDGGIDGQSIFQAKEAGANVFVAGSYVFNGDVNERVQTLRDAVNG